MLKTNNLLRALLMVFVMTFLPAVLVYLFVGFEISLIFTICLAAASVAASIVGLENIVILTKRELKNETVDQE